MKKPIVVNLYGGPGTGKSTTAAGTFFRLKLAGINCELVTEYAKSKVWEESNKVLHDQLYIFGKQNHKMEILRDHVDVIITDSPLLLSLVYGRELSDAFKMLVMEHHTNWDNVEIFLNRVKPYNPKGRSQSENESIAIDGVIKEIFDSHSITTHSVDGDFDAPETIMNMILDKIKFGKI